MQDPPGPGLDTAIELLRDRLAAGAKTDRGQLTSREPPALHGRQSDPALENGRDQFALVLGTSGGLLARRGRLDGKRPAHAGAEGRMGKLSASARIDARQSGDNRITRSCADM